MTLSRQILERRLRTPFRYVASVGSTNDVARDWLLDGAPGGAAVIADEQTRGKGRMGRRWLTRTGTALAVSIVLHPKEAFAGRVVQLGALAVCDMAESLGCRGVGIKPPNDVLLDGKKVAGILPEAVWDGGTLRGVVLGIGVNVRMDFRGTDLEASAASLESALGKTLDRAALLEELIGAVMLWNGQIESEAFDQAWKRWLLTSDAGLQARRGRETADAMDGDGA